MKRILLTMMAAFCLFSAYAQEIVVGDMNDDGEITVEDVAKVSATALGKVEKRTISTACDPDKSTPEAVAGSWRSVGAEVITLKADGTATHSGKSEVVSFEYYPFSRDLLLLNAGGYIVQAYDVLRKTTAFLVLCEKGSKDNLVYYPAAHFTEDISFAEASVEVNSGKTVQLNPVATPPNAIISALEWTSSNEEVATVDANGLVTGHKGGTAVITATAKDGTGKSAKCVVMVNQMVTFIELSQTILILDVDESQKLTATVLPEDVTNKTVTWTSSNEEVAMVLKGTVVAMGYGTCTITCSATDGSGVEATCKVKVTQAIYGHEYVDLGLPSGLKWATCNVGADNPEDYGDYYAWGETETKSTYNWSTYKWCNGTSSTMTKYCIKSSSGTVDNKTTLDPKDDVAHVKWGGDWRMPTKAEQDELRDTNNCTWTWTTQGGKKGYLVTSKKNGYSIFLPAAGGRLESDLNRVGSGGWYWSSSLYTSSASSNASLLHFDSGIVDDPYAFRIYGQTVRPVCP